MLIGYVSILTQTKMGVGSVIFLSMGPMRGQYLLCFIQINSLINLPNYFKKLGG